MSDDEKLVREVDADYDFWAERGMAAGFYSKEWWLEELYTACRMAWGVIETEEAELIERWRKHEGVTDIWDASLGGSEEALTLLLDAVKLARRSLAAAKAKADRAA